MSSAGTNGSRTFRAKYFGSVTLDRRYTASMLPWLLAEAKHRGKPGKGVRLEVKGRSVVTSSDGGVCLQHDLGRIYRFLKTSTDRRCFSYLVRQSKDSPTHFCYVFEADCEKSVQDLFSVMREATKDTCSDCNISSGSGMSDSISQRFELLYVGKIKVSHCKPPPTFIDEAIEKFRLHELEKMKQFHEALTASEVERQRHSSGASVASLPSNLEHMVTIRENALKDQVELSGSSCSEENDCFVKDFVGPSQQRLSESGWQSGDEVVSHFGNGDIYGIAQKVLRSQVEINIDDAVVKRRAWRSSGSISSPAFSSDGVRDRSQSSGTHHDVHDSCRTRDSFSFVGQNRTMVFQVGNNEVSFVSLDKKSIIFKKPFKDIAHCSQGIRHPDHFGFICRETNADSYVGYILKCQADTVAEEILTTLKQVFASAAAQQRILRSQFVVCETCPMIWLHKLCAELEGLSVSKCHEIILKRLDTLSNDEKSDILTKLEGAEDVSTQEQNEILMMLLRALCETKQTKHVHGDATHNNKHDASAMGSLHEKKHTSSSSVLDDLKKARRSLTSSFETILKRKNKDDLRKGFRERSCTIDFDSRKDSSGNCTSEGSSSCSTPETKDGNYVFLDDNVKSDREFRRRSSTFGGTRGPHGSMEQLHLKLSKKKTSPMKSIFLKVGSQSKTSTPVPDDEKCTPKKGSWRQAIFNRVVTPQQKSIQGISPSKMALLSSPISLKRSPESLRILWRKAIKQQILLIRMDRENQKLKANQDAAEVKRVKLTYEEITPCLKDITKVWETWLLLPPGHHIEFNELINAVKAGVPRQRRGEIWELLTDQYKIYNRTSLTSTDEIDVSPAYEILIKQLTSQQHAILIDLGRTFPGHPYFSDSLGAGQLALFNLLKAYSLRDPEVGYCQGLSFIAGVLLLHMEEEDAFDMLEHIMFTLGIRRQFKPDMVSLQIQLYQLSRLLHDHHRELYVHFEKNDIAPTLYAAPWFLTLFASQFPLGFVARVFDLIFIYGMEVAIKVALVLLGNHKELIIQCQSFESIMDFMKATLPSMGIIQMERVFNQVFALDIAKELYAYEIEYHVLQEEVGTFPLRSETDDTVSRLELANRSLKRQNVDLLEELQIAHSNVSTLERNISSYQACTSRQESRLKALKLETATLRQLVEVFRKRWPREHYDECADIVSEYQHVLRPESPLSSLYSSTNNISSVFRENSVTNSLQDDDEAWSTNLRVHSIGDGSGLSQGVTNSYYGD